MTKIEFIAITSTKNLQIYSSAVQATFSILPSILSIEKKENKFEKTVKFRTNYFWNKCETLTIKAIGFDNLFYGCYEDSNTSKLFTLIFCFSLDNQNLNVEIYEK
jgi:hypothetical protein